MNETPVVSALHVPIYAALYNALAGSPARAFADAEALKIATTIATIARLREEGAITAEQGAALLDLQKHATQAVLLASEGVGVVQAQVAINAALAAVGAAVQKAIGAVL